MQSRNFMKFQDISSVQKLFLQIVLHLKELVNYAAKVQPGASSPGMLKHISSCRRAIHHIFVPVCFHFRFGDELINVHLFFFSIFHYFRILPSIGSTIFVQFAGAQKLHQGQSLPCAGSRAKRGLCRTPSLQSSAASDKQLTRQWDSTHVHHSIWCMYDIYV